MRARAPKTFLGERSTSRAADHAIREQRLEAIRDAVEQFSFTLALLIAGHDAPGNSASDDVIAKLQIEIRPFLAGGEAMRPDFGAFGDLRVEGDLLDPSQPVLATLEFDDHCVRETTQGRLVPSRRRRMRMTMRVAIDPVHIIDCAVSEVAAQHA
jgi:hypothetical protein